MTTERSWPDSPIANDLANLRRVAPLTHCVTNVVAAGFTANILLAAGASPAMVEASEEVAEFAAIAAGVLINVGTVTAQSAAAMSAAAAAARRAGTPWVLDPVAAGALQFRTQLASALLAERPAIVRGNASEILALAGASGGGKGVDSTADSGDALPLARELAARSGAVVAVSGIVDYITDGETTLAVPGGDVFMTKVTGVGCALGALMAAFLAVSASPLEAATSASAVLAAAAERAAREVRGPGSFSVALLDQLWLLGAG
ncbi:MAG: hydroxyethylthiazole kinase [Candidatus Baltobacteraceae bacterium]